MNDSEVFTWVCAKLAELTQLSKNEARGTMRLVLKDAGLEAKYINTKQMAVILSHLLPAALQRVDVDNSTAVCTQVADALPGAGLDSPLLHTPEDVFGRLAR